MDELEQAPVYQGLRWQWSFYGLTLLHFAGAGFIGSLVLFFCILSGLSVLWGIAAFLGGCAGLAVMQWRQDPNYMGDLLMSLLEPRHLTPAEPDEITHPFPVAPEDLL